MVREKQIGVGKTVRELRTSRNISVAELASMMGCSIILIQLIESGTRSLTEKKAANLCNVLKLSNDERVSLFKKAGFMTSDSKGVLHFPDNYKGVICGLVLGNKLIISIEEGSVKICLGNGSFKEVKITDDAIISLTIQN